MRRSMLAWPLFLAACQPQVPPEEPSTLPKPPVWEDLPPPPRHPCSLDDEEACAELCDEADEAFACEMVADHLTKSRGSRTTLLAGKLLFERSRLFVPPAPRKR